MAWYVARSVNVLRDEINAAAPNRSKVSDGSIGDAAHSTRSSDHNPCSCHGAVCARDITHDPAGGFDSYAFADWLRKRCQAGTEKRVKYIISNKRIASGTTNNWNWRTYYGPNPHSRHVHVSVAHGPSSFDNASSWGWNVTIPPPKPPTSTGVYVVQGYRKTVRQGTQGKMAKMCQQQINLIGGQGVAEDGDFGPQSVGGLKNVQAVLGVPADGVCGQQTWQAFENGIKVQAEAGDWD